MTKLLVGSTAAKHWFPDFRDARDIDYLVSDPDEEMRNTRGIEYFYHPYLKDIVEEHVSAIAEPYFLYTLKVSHAFWALRNGSWDKHMNDIKFFQGKGVDFAPGLYDVFYKTWEEVHGKKRAKLTADTTASEFFTKAVERVYDHDSIHDSIAYGSEPMFNRILRDGSEVAVSKDKFLALTHEEKCQLVREEVYATALERILIPSDFTKSPRMAYHWALRQTITSFSKGWFPLWIVLNYRDVEKPDCDYVQRHKDNAERLILLEA